MSTILIPPIVLTVAPIVAGRGRRRSARCRRNWPHRSLAQRPEWAAFTPGELAGAFAVQQFLAFFLLMPAYIPLSIATFSIIGEKQARSLEPVLAAPIRTIELLAGKSVAALVPGVLAGWVTYVVFVALASIVYGPNLIGVVTDPSWLAGVFLLGPALGLSSVVAGRPRERPGQRSARRAAGRWRDHRSDRRRSILIQATGTVLVGAVGYAVTGLDRDGHLAHGPADRRPTVRPGGDPHALAVIGRRDGRQRFGAGPGSVRCAHPRLDPSFRPALAHPRRPSATIMPR